MSMKRRGGRKARELRPVRITRRFTMRAAGSVLIRAGDTHVLCTACIEEGVPEWREPSGLGWLTAEYDMLPGSTSTRRSRNRSGVDGRTQEIQRLIGRCLRSVVDFAALGKNTILIDCDVLQADGGTRTASITGAYVALHDAVAHGIKQGMISRKCLRDQVAAVSVGLVEGEILVDLDYEEDAAADVDLNLVMTGSGRFVEVQGSAEERTFGHKDLDKMLALGMAGIRRILSVQKKALNSAERRA